MLRDWFQPYSLIAIQGFKDLLSTTHGAQMLADSLTDVVSVWCENTIIQIFNLCPDLSLRLKEVVSVNGMLEFCGDYKSANLSRCSGSGQNAPFSNHVKNTKSF